MVIAYDVNTVQEYVAQAALMGPARPVLIDQFLEEATEVDVDALADGEDVVIGGMMEHIEEAGRALGRFFVRASSGEFVAFGACAHSRLYKASWRRHCRSSG